MNSRCFKSLRLLAVLQLFLSMAVSASMARAPAALGVQLYAGLSISGSVGTVYAIQSTTDLAQSNSWSTRTLLQLPLPNYLWVDPSGSASGGRFYRAVAVPAPTNMVFILPGSFLMGSPADEPGRQAEDSGEDPRPTVLLTKGFFMGIYPVTQQEYLSVLHTNPSFHSSAYAVAITNGSPATNGLPVEHVTWFDATNYCNQLTQRELAAGRILAGTRFRLPTEAEWEYACRAGSTTRFSYGSDDCPVDFGRLAQYAWYADHNFGRPAYVGQLRANPWGLYDMHGLVFEWCQDRYGPYTGGTVADPQGPSVGGVSGDRVLRGNGYSFGRTYCRSASRKYDPPTYYSDDYGFRVVLAVGEL